MSQNRYVEWSAHQEDWDVQEVLTAPFGGDSGSVDRSFAQGGRPRLKGPRSQLGESPQLEEWLGEPD